MVQSQENIVYGLTGEVGRDGILSPDQQLVLDRKQHEAAQTILGHLGRRQEGELFPAAVMATGIGKTRVEHEVIESWRRKNPGAKILFIAGTKLTLVNQTQVALTSYQQNINGGGNDYIESEDLERDSQETEDVEDALRIEQEDLPFYRIGRLKDKNVDVRVATIQTIQSAYKRGQLDYNEFDLVIVDEVHNIGTADRARVIKLFKNVAGFTATPYRHSGNLRQPEEYGFDVAYNFPLPEAQNLRLLPPLLGMQIDTSDLVEEIPTTRNGQINYKRLEQILKKSPDLRPFIADKVAQIIKDGEKEYKTVIAVNFVWEAQELAQLLKEKGVKVGVAVNQQAARQIHSDEIPAIGTIERYKLPKSNPNSIQVLISPYVASEGFDAPFTEVIVWASPTDSDLRYTQYVGRLARRAEGKLFGLNLDFLYQTSQYGWSYNMGMWMKGDVRQLPNGLLYLGPESDIAGLAELDVVRSMRGKVDVMDIANIQREALEEVKDTDFVLTNVYLENHFVGIAAKLRLVAEEIKKELLQEDPTVYSNLFTRRLRSTSTVQVCTDKELFTRFMQEKGIILVPNINLQPNDIALDFDGLNTTFRGLGSKLNTMVENIKDRIKKEDPDLYDQLFVFRLRTTQQEDRAMTVTVGVCTDRQRFIHLMLEAGAELKDYSLLSVQEGDFSLVKESLTNTFMGKVKEEINPMVDQVKARIKLLYPEKYDGLFQIRYNKPRYVEVCTDEKLFVQSMQEVGARLKDKTIKDIQDRDVVLGVDKLADIFEGGRRFLGRLAEEIGLELSQTDPVQYKELFTTRRSGKVLARVCTDKDLFIRLMKGKGAILKSGKVKD